MKGVPYSIFFGGVEGNVRIWLFCSTFCDNKTLPLFSLHFHNMKYADTIPYFLLAWKGELMLEEEENQVIAWCRYIFF